MHTIFEETYLGAMKVKNRFVRSGTWTAEADDHGAVTLDLVNRVRELAEGGVGLIITGYSFVTREGQAAPHQLGSYDDAMVTGLARLADSVHEGGGQVVLQLAHGGIFSATELTGAPALGPYPLETEQGPVGRAMTTAEIGAVVSAFAAAAGRAVRAGFDGVQIDAAHGLAHSQFLSPFFNKRQDGYGVTLENRARFLFETVDAIRAVVGNRYPLLVKMNSTDKLAGGFSIEELIEVSRNLEGHGVDAIEMSGGTVLGLFVDNLEMTFCPAREVGVYYQGPAEAFKRKVGLPLMLVGGIRSYQEACSLIERETADYICLCRPLIREPDLIRQWENGRNEEAACISDSACIFESLTKGRGLRCVHLDRTKSTTQTAASSR